MSFKSTSLRAMGLLVALTVASAAQAGTKYYSVNGGGGQAQIGDGLPIPAQDQYSSMGGKNFTNGPIGTFTNFPPLLIPINKDKSKALIKQTTTMTMQPKMTVAPGVFRRIPTTNGKVTGVPVPLYIGVAKNNARVLQVRTTLSFSGPAPMLTTPMGQKAPGTLVFKTGQRVNKTSTYNGTPVGSKVVYKSKGARFGGPSQTKLKNLGSIGVWADLADNIKVSTLPCKHPTFLGPDSNCFATKVPAYPRTLGAAGGPKSNVQTTAGAPGAMPGKVNLSVAPPTSMGVVAGTVLQSKATGPATGAINNMATSIGFPWTTGALTISQPAAVAAPEKFHITGMDGRVKGVGTIQLVSSSLSKRLATGPNANRSWAEYQLPEPGAVLGAAAALAVLGLCHGLVRRRR
jgi:hypothetical protein